VAHILLSRPDKSNNFSPTARVCTKAMQLDQIDSTITTKGRTSGKSGKRDTLGAYSSK